jgi:ribosomal protein S18 acetylase RimI-like enzyme
MDAARARGVEHVYVHVVVDNGAAVGLYERSGFRLEAQESADSARKRQHGRRLLLVRSL